MTANGPGKMVQWLKVFPAKSEELSLVLGVVWWMERTEASRLSSAPYILQIAGTRLAPRNYAFTHLWKHNKIIIISNKEQIEWYKQHAFVDL